MLMQLLKELRSLWVVGLRALLSAFSQKPSLVLCHLNLSVGQLTIWQLPSSKLARKSLLTKAKITVLCHMIIWKLHALFYRLEASPNPIHAYEGRVYEGHEYQESPSSSQNHHTRASFSEKLSPHSDRVDQQLLPYVIIKLVILENRATYLLVIHICTSSFTSQDS